ncbi:MAG: hypothetical protein ACRDKU_02090 [Gaiellaceae bacterium]
MKELDVEAVRGAARELRDPVLLLEDQDELLAGVFEALNLIEPKRQRRRLLAGYEEQTALDVVGPSEVVAFVQCEFPRLARSRPLLELLRVVRERLVDVDPRFALGPLLRSRPWHDLNSWHDASVPPAFCPQT